MCFAPQLACTFSTSQLHQKWSEAEVFCTFWLRNVLRATMACTFSTSQLPKVVRTWCVLYILTSKVLHAACNFSSLIWPDGSAHAALASLLFDPSGATNHWKNTVFRDFPTFPSFAHLHLLSSDSFSSLICSLLLFSSLCLFPSLLFICPCCRKFDFQTSFDNGLWWSMYGQGREQGSQVWKCWTSFSQPCRKKSKERERESAQVQRRLRTQDSLFASGTTPRGAHGLKLETQELAQEATGEDRTCCQRALHLPSPII